MFEPGSVVGGKYRLDHQIGQGGMATIWRAVHMDLGRPVAVKFLTIKGKERDRVRDQFLAEARLAASVRHRNVVDIIDFGTAEGDVPYMVMELLEGRILADRLTDGPPLHVGEFIRLIADSLTGLQAVHDAGIVHRDLKPENVFLVRDSDGSVYPKLLDFGISRVDRNARTSVRQSVPTMDGLIVGTPHYMSPEQARGLKDIDQRTDIYSMGVMLYEGLSGELPFDSENPGDLLVMVTTQVATPLASLRPELGQAISDVIERAMARARDARWKSALEMRDALVQAAEQTALLAPTWGMVTTGATQTGQRSIPTAYMEEEPEHRKRGGTWLWLTAGVAAVGAAAGIGLMTQNGGASTSPVAPAEASAPATAEAPAETVRVRLHGVPPTGGVRVDDAPVSGSEIVLPRDGQPHEIDVTVDGRSVWSTTHRAIADADYDVALALSQDEPAEAEGEEEIAEAAPRRAARRPRQARGAAMAAAIAEMAATETEAAEPAETPMRASPPEPARDDTGQLTDPGF